MSLQLKIRRKPLAAGKYQQRLHRAQAAAQTGTARAAERIGPAARRAREAAAQGISDARTWTAPRLERSARYVESELGPRVGSMLHTTAHKVRPAKTRSKGRIVALVLLVAGGVASTVGALARRRNNVASSGVEDQDVPADAEAMSDNGQVRTS
ncbi:MAG TPA: hypothetical protein VFU43_10365 [Streptosporangiaceae bacterium]|nr:hypothetical protein [Streptosporangiaceae bacterium]